MIYTHVLQNNLRSVMTPLDVTTILGREAPSFNVCFSAGKCGLFQRPVWPSCCLEYFLNWELSHQWCDNYQIPNDTLALGSNRWPRARELRPNSLSNAEIIHLTNMGAGNAGRCRPTTRLAAGLLACDMHRHLSI